MNAIKMLALRCKLRLPACESYAATRSGADAASPRGAGEARSVGLTLKPVHLRGGAYDGEICQRDNMIQAISMPEICGVEYALYLRRNMPVQYYLYRRIGNSDTFRYVGMKL